MPRPHEDRERHTPTDHAAGGPILILAPGTWWAIDVLRVAAERAPAAIASYETLIEKARASKPKAHEAALLRSDNHRRVIVMLRMDGHEAFRHLASAWDDHHLFAERRAVAESQSLALFRLGALTGEAVLDPKPHDAFAFEHILQSVERVRQLTAAVASAPGYRGSAVFGSADDTTSAIVYRFTHIAEIEAYRATPATQRILGPVARSGEAFFPVHIVRTFGG
jgi:hypothetical protein